jgi:hypothetical protein
VALLVVSWARMFVAYARMHVFQNSFPTPRISIRDEEQTLGGSTKASMSSSSVMSVGRMNTHWMCSLFGVDLLLYRIQSATVAYRYWARILAKYTI